MRIEQRRESACSFESSMIGGISSTEFVLCCENLRLQVCVLEVSPQLPPTVSFNQELIIIGNECSSKPGAAGVAGAARRFSRRSNKIVYGPRTPSLCLFTGCVVPHAGSRLVTDGVRSKSRARCCQPTLRVSPTSLPVSRS